jgi:hypothetical protein
MTAERRHGVKDQGLGIRDCNEFWKNLRYTTRLDGAVMESRCRRAINGSRPTDRGIYCLPRKRAAIFSRSGVSMPLRCFRVNSWIRFLAYATARGRRVAVVQVRESQTALFLERGFTGK